MLLPFVFIVVVGGAGNVHGSFDNVHAVAVVAWCPKLIDVIAGVRYSIREESDCDVEAMRGGKPHLIAYPISCCFSLELYSLSDTVPDYALWLHKVAGA